MNTMAKHVPIPSRDISLTQKSVLGVACLPHYSPRGTFGHYTLYDWCSPIATDARRAFLISSDYKGMLISKVQFYE